MTMKMRTKKKHVLNFEAPAFSCGALAIAETAANTFQSLSWIVGTDHLNLMMAGLYNSGVRDGDNVNAVFALPSATFRPDPTNGIIYADEFLRMVNGKEYTVKPAGKKAITFRLHATAQKQGIMAMLNNALPFGGQIDQAWKEKALIIGAGGHTTELFRIVGGKLSGTSESSESTGIKTVADALRSEMVHLENIPMTPAEAMQAVQDKQYSFLQREIEWVPDFVDGRLAVLAEHIAQAARRVAGPNAHDIGTFERYLLTGGAGIVLAPHLKKSLPMFPLSATALHDESLGALKVAMSAHQDGVVNVGCDIGLYSVKMSRMTECDGVVNTCFESATGPRVDSESIKL